MTASREGRPDNDQSVRVIVVNHNGGELLRRCIDSLLDVDWPPNRLEIVVVDNASADESLDRLPGDQRLTIIRLDENVGFGAANNVALDDLGQTEFVALLNPDAVIEPDALGHLVRTLTDDRAVGAACPKILLGLPGDPGDDRRRIQNAGSAVSRSGNGIDRGFGQLDGPPFDQATDVFAWCGAAVLLRRSYLDDVGGFEPRFFLYYEDTDLAWRGRSRGWRHRFTPAAVVHHRLGAITGSSGPTALRHQTAGRLLMMTRNARMSFAVWAWVRALAGAAAASARRSSSAAARRQGVRDAFGALPWALRDRPKLATRQRVSRRALSRQLGHLYLRTPSR